MIGSGAGGGGGALLHFNINRNNQLDVIACTVK